MENGDSTDAVAELPMPPMATPSAAQVRALMHAWVATPTDGVLTRPSVSLPSKIRSSGRVLLLDGVQDPGNLGTLLRTAVAFRWAAVALLPGCCDPFNPKAVRAARGACFRMPLWRIASWNQLLQLAAGMDVTLLAADPTGDATGRAMDHAVSNAGTGGPLWLALGAEGQGLSASAPEGCTRIAIPGAGA